MISGPDWADDYLTGLIGGGIPSAYHLASAVADGDYEAAMYYAKIEAAVLGTQFGFLTFLNWYQGPKYATSFHHLKSGLSFGRSQVLQNPVVIGAASMEAQRQTWESIGDPMTGAIHYASAGMMSGGSMPVITEYPRIDLGGLMAGFMNLFDQHYIMECKECGMDITYEVHENHVCWDCFSELLVTAENKEQQKKTSAEEEQVAFLSSPTPSHLIRRGGRVLPMRPAHLAFVTIVGHLTVNVTIGEIKCTIGNCLEIGVVTNVNVG